MATRPVKTAAIAAGLLAEARAAMRSGVEATDAEVLERVLRSYLGRRALNAAQAMNELSDDGALWIADEDLRAMRRGRRTAT